MIKFSRIVDSLPESTPFVGPETQQRQRKTQFVARLGANENVFGPSPEVLKEVEKATSDIWMYADPENFDLKQAIATHHGLNIENIVVGEGIDGLLGYLCRLFVEPGVNVVTSKGAYPTFNYHVLGFGGELKVVPYKNDFEDIEGLVCEAKRCEGSIIYLANPDNPMGTFHSGSVIEDMVSNLPAGTLLCLDEAYSEFAIKRDLPKIDPNNTQVVRFRTFSKAYGLAGARVGYAIGPSKIIKAFDKIRNHFGVNIIAQRAAKVALEDQKYLLSVINSVAIAKCEIEKIVKKNKVIITSRSVSKARKKIKFLKQNKIINLNVLNKKNIENFILKYKPNKIFYFAGQSSPAISFKKPKETYLSNFIGCKNFLEIILFHKLKCKFINSSSCEIFGNIKKKINLKSKKSPVSPYGKAKLDSFNITKKFRNKEKVLAYNAVIFNTESIFRDKNYLIPKICMSAINAYKFKKKLHLETLIFQESGIGVQSNVMR